MNIDNKTMTAYQTSDFLKLPITKPSIQRLVILDKVADIIEYQLDFRKKNGFFNFNGSLNLHILDDKMFLIDGQHRFKALEQLYLDHSHDIMFFVEITKVATLEELKENYSMINKNTPLPDFSDFTPDSKNMVEAAMEDLQIVFSKVWSKGSSRSRRPYMNFNSFQESLCFITENIAIKDPKKLIELVTDYNEKLGGWSSFKNVNEPMYKKARELKCLLGLFPLVDEDYRYEWTKKIVEEQTGKNITRAKNKDKTKIPKKLKNDSWDKYIGNNKGVSICLCCRITQIDSKNFTAGHIISEFNGGKTTIDNIVPICQGCNCSMGVTNMDLFIKEFYPDNYDQFVTKKYTSEKNVFQKILGTVLPQI